MLITINTTKNDKFTSTTIEVCAGNIIKVDESTLYENANNPLELHLATIHTINIALIRMLMSMINMMILDISDPDTAVLIDDIDDQPEDVQNAIRNKLMPFPSVIIN